MRIGVYIVIASNTTNNKHIMSATGENYRYKGGLINFPLTPYSYSENIKSMMNSKLPDRYQHNHSNPKLGTYRQNKILNIPYRQFY